MTAYEMVKMDELISQALKLKEEVIKMMAENEGYKRENEYLRRIIDKSILQSND